MGFCGGAARVDYVYSLWFARGDGQVGVANASEERPAFLLEAVLVFGGVGVLASAITATGAFHAEGGFVVEQDGQVGLQVAAEGFVQLERRFDAQLAASALVSFGGIGEAVAKNDASIGEGRQNDLVDVLGAGSEHERHFRKRREPRRGRVQQHVAYLFTRGCAARFAGDSDGEAVGAQGPRQFLDLRALTTAVKTFEGDEFSARGHVGNDSRREASFGFSPISLVRCADIFNPRPVRGGGTKEILEVELGSRFGVRECLVFTVVLLSSVAAFGNDAAHISLVVDASEAPRKIIHAQLRIPAKPGTLTLYYPKWIPGEHGPTGPITDLTGLKFSASGKTLAWRRDLLDGYTFHVEVPAGENEVIANLDYASPASAEAGYTAGLAATEKVYIVNWNTLLLYPTGFSSDQLTRNASLRLPAGWKFGTSLHVSNQAGREIHFVPASLTMLVDGPVLAGEYFKAVPLSTENPPAELDIASDSAAALEAPAELWDHYRNLVKQAGLLFGARHYTEYHFLLTLSDHVAHFGLEHHESNDSRIEERSLIEEDGRKSAAGLLPHEYVHSWNGKYRRPADLATPEYEQPMQTDLLWVYEGLTSYLGDMLAARSGERTPQLARDSLALIAADINLRSGRAWRNLQDTADGVPTMQSAPRSWGDYRRGLDYYDEDVLNWLWADVIIRQQSKGAKSLDDFCHLFHGAPGGPPSVRTYTFEDVVNTLDQVTPYDWRGFWMERMTNHGPGGPLGGVEGSGWKLTFDENPSELQRAENRDGKSLGAHYSVGLMAGSDGVVRDTVDGMAATKAGIGPGMKIVAVNGRRFSADVWHDAIRAAKESTAPIELIVENTDYFRVVKLDYHGGEKYPHLVRYEAKPDLLTEIYRAK